MNLDKISAGMPQNVANCNQSLLRCWREDVHCQKCLNQFCKMFEFGIVQKWTNIVDLKKCCEMIICLQKSASIQPRTNLPKFLRIRNGPRPRPLHPEPSIPLRIRICASRCPGSFAALRVRPAERRIPGGRRRRGGGRRGAGGGLPTLVESGSIGEGPNHSIRTIQIRVRSEFCQNQGDFARIYPKFRNFQH